MNITPDFITESDENDLVLEITLALEKIPERKGWLRNRVARFGWDYEITNKWLGEIPGWVPWVNGGASWRLIIGHDKPDSVTINEYLRGQRIAPHIDSPAFGDVAILSLLADATMRFTSPAGQTQDFLLPRRSLAVMSGELRNTWMHETLPLDADARYSVVYRKRVA